MNVKSAKTGAGWVWNSLSSMQYERRDGRILAVAFGSDGLWTGYLFLDGKRIDLKFITSTPRAARARLSEAHELATGFSLSEIVFHKNLT